MEVKYNQEVAKPVVKRGSNNKYHPSEPFTACHGMHRLVKKASTSLPNVAYQTFHSQSHLLDLGLSVKLLCGLFCLFLSDPELFQNRADVLATLVAVHLITLHAH